MSYLTVHNLVVLPSNLLPDWSQSLAIATPGGKEHYKVRRPANLKKVAPLILRVIKQ